MMLSSITPIFTALIVALVLWAFRRNALSFQDTAISDIMAGVFWMMLSTLARMIFWAIPLIFPDFSDFSMFKLGSSFANPIFEIVLAFGGLRLLRGFLLMIPDDDRPHYNIFTAAFYPRRIKLRITREKE